MIFLKWYSIVFMILGLLCGLYEYGKERKILNFVLMIIFDSPIIIYLFLS